MKKTRFLTALLCAVLLFSVAAAMTSCGDTSYESLADEATYPRTETVTNYILMNVSYTDAEGHAHVGDIVVEMDPANAPLTVANFQKLVGSDFYDGLTFHRVVQNFVIQGGDPKGTGNGNAAESVKGEFTANGVGNAHPHTRGTISMARATPYDSASCQFFIVTQTSASNTYSLDGKYAAFGQMLFGFDTLDGIAALPTDPINDKPLKTVTINYMTFVNYTPAD